VFTELQDWCCCYCAVHHGGVGRNQSSVRGKRKTESLDCHEECIADSMRHCPNTALTDPEILEIGDHRSSNDENSLMLTRLSSYVLTAVKETVRMVIACSSTLENCFKVAESWRCTDHLISDRTAKQYKTRCAPCAVLGRRGAEIYSRYGIREDYDAHGQ